MVDLTEIASFVVADVATGHGVPRILQHLYHHLPNVPGVARDEYSLPGWFLHHYFVLCSPSRAAGVLSQIFHSARSVRHSWFNSSVSRYVSMHCQKPSC